MRLAWLSSSVSLTALLAGSAALAGETSMVAANAAGVFSLGQIEQVTISASPLSGSISESIVTQEETFTFNALTLDRALDLATGAVSGTTGGPRNERLFFIRGFDRFQAPLYVDGIRVYLPADNRLDAGFFLTSNLAHIQVEKGYVSVLSGPGAMGGAVNLVTRKPALPFEYEARAGVALAGNGAYNGFNSSILAGGNTGTQYWQASAAITKTDHFRLPEDFTPSASEDGGFRDHSNARNYNLNLKYGWTPNRTDEYSLSYTGTWGQKDATLSTIDTVSSQRNWRWPYWNVQSLYFLSNTGIGDTATVQTKLYYSDFRNALVSFDNANYNSQVTPRAFVSWYSDNAYGGSIEAGKDFGGRDTLKGAFFYRRDEHVEWQKIFVPAFTEPEQVSVEDTFSAAVENRLHVTEQIDFVAGASYDRRHLIRAEDYVDPTTTKAGFSLPYKLADGDAFNAQGALIHAYSGTGHAYANVSSRARFPTLFERFSTRFGATISNPGLNAERATNYEIGAGDTVFGTTRVDAAVFYSDIAKALINVPIEFCDTTSAATPKSCTGAGGLTGVLTATSQTQNVGDGTYYGFEFSADSRVRDWLQAGVRFTYLQRDIDAQNPANPPVAPNFHLTGAPNAQLLAYATFDVTDRLSVTPNVQAASDRWTNTTNGAFYFKTGAFTLWNLEAQYAVTDRMVLQLGGRNLFDSGYQLVGGFPSEGRSFFVNLRVRG